MLRRSRDGSEAPGEGARPQLADAIFERSPIGYFTLDDEGRIGQANAAGARLLGAPRGELAGLHLRSFVARRDWRAFEEFRQRAAQPGPPPGPAEFLLARATAGAGELRVTALAAEGPELLLAVEDVSARCRAERQLLESARRKDEFLAALSHELRNPLAPIRNGLVLLHRSPPGTELGRRALAVVDRQVTHLIRIVEDLLDVTRLARGKIELRRERIDLGAHAARTAEDYRAAFDAGGIRLECRLAAEPAWIDADPSRVAQVLGALLANALKFTARGGEAEVAVSGEPGAAVLRVRDSGVGLTPEVRATLFEPFAQAPQTLERTGGGLGLGLAMVKGLVELHGGEVEARSEGPGRGTELVVRFPAARPPSVEAPDGGPDAIAPRHRILIVDDNEDAANTLRDVLELWGEEVRVALDGTAGLREAQAFRPDVVICDIGLPEMDGYAVARALRCADETRAAWLVALSGYATPEDVQRAQAAGFDRHVAKPASFDRLRALLAEAPAPVGRPEAHAPPGPEADGAAAS